MPNQHDLQKHQVAVKFPHPIWRQIEKAAADRCESPSQYIREIVTETVHKVPLTGADAQIIADRIKEAEQKRRMV